MYPVTPLSPSLAPLTPSNPQRRTHIMSILNVTPDSFSDGGAHSPTDLQTITDTVLSHISAGATILDIGGQSTRPNAPYLSPSEELARVLPVLRHIKQIPQAQNVAISLDTFHSSVAQTAAQENLIDIINDVSAGTLDPHMLHVAAETRRTIILMHMRGTPATMSQLTDYHPDGVTRGVARELDSRVAAALAAGIPPWRIILDPGIGFSKTAAQNLELLRGGPDAVARTDPRLSLAAWALPWLVGASRKGFVGRVTGVREPKERGWGTAACVTAAVATGADVVRVHDVREMRAVVDMADAIYRGFAEGEKNGGSSRGRGEI